MNKGKRKDCQILLEWAPAINRHMYWVAASSGGDQELARAKWLSMMNHVVDKHSGHSVLFPVCLHDEINRNWMKEGKIEFFFCFKIGLIMII